MTYRSISTVKADVARRWFQAEGEGIVWAVVDSGIDREHRHFVRHQNLDLAAPLQHRDFTTHDANGSALTDDSGHGTHTAAIIAGEMLSVEGPMIALERARDAEGRDKLYPRPLAAISGMAPRTKLLSLKVLDASGEGPVSNVIAALDYIQNLNEFGRRLRVHGVNLGVGYSWDPEWFACGESPLCIEVNRLVHSGVLVIASAGNTGYGYHGQGYGVSINDPGNAELAITVGSTHRDQPLTYGVSYFSSKGPTLDGRAKPDLVAPGEYIVSAIPRSIALAAAERKDVDLSSYAADTAYYQEDSGTSRAAAHVSGVAAGLLSLRRELIGRPGEVKSMLKQTATSLNRHQDFQGAGLVDLLRALFPLAASIPSAGAAQVGSDLPAMLPVPVGPQPQFRASTESLATATGTSIRLMISYAHEDEKYKAMLTAHLSALSRSGRIDVWQDREIPPGKEYAPEILKQIDQANIIVLLISADFLASDYCYQKEMTRAIERHRKGEGKVRIIPVIVRDVDWKDTPIRGLNALPKDGVAITLWEDIDKAWRNVAVGIRTAVQELTGE